MAGYGAFDLPKLDTRGPDIAGSFMKGQEVQNLATRNALMTEQLKEMPAERERREQRFENEKTGWGRETERFGHEKEQWEPDKRAKALKFAVDANNFVKESLATIRPDEYPQYIESLKAKGIPTDQFPPSFNSPEEFEAFRKRVIETTQERVTKLTAELHSTEAQRHEAWQGKESEKTRSFQAGESEKTRAHQDTTGIITRTFQSEEAEKGRQFQLQNEPLVETEEGYQPRSMSQGLYKWRDPRDLKLDEAEKSRIHLLQKEGEGLIKMVQDYRAKTKDEFGKPKVTAEQAAEAVRRLSGIEADVKAIIDKARVVNSPRRRGNALAVPVPSAAGIQPAPAAGAGANPGGPSALAYEAPSALSSAQQTDAVNALAPAPAAPAADSVVMAASPDQEIAAQPPAAAQTVSPPVRYPDGQILVNPKTGEKGVVIGGKLMTPPSNLFLPGDNPADVKGKTDRWIREQVTQARAPAVEAAARAEEEARAGKGAEIKAKGESSAAAERARTKEEQAALRRRKKKAEEESQG